MNDALAAAVHQILAWPVPAIIALAAVYGLFVGAVPGLTATMAVALLIPFTFFLDDVPALAAIVTLVACAIFAGDIPTTLVRIPGTPSSAAYVDDVYGLTRQGRQEQSLGVSLVFSAVGGLFGAVVLMALAPWLARLAFSFTSYEYFWLTLLGLSSAAIVSRGSVLKGALALLIGLLLSTVGLGEVHGAPRFTFGRDELIAGINFIPSMIGLFGLSEVLRHVLAGDEPVGPAPAAGPPLRRRWGRRLWDSFRGLVGPPLPLIWRRRWHVARSGSVGALIGVLPGAGADIAGWISFALSKRFSKRPEEYGRGSLEGVADATAANNAALAGTWVPTLVFGIPGDSITAIVIGVLLMKNVVPGPEIFTHPQQAVLVYSIYVSFVLANLLLLPLGWLAVRAGIHLVRVPRRMLVPIVLLFAIVGAYAINASYFDVWVMLAMGLLGFVLDRYGVPLGPVVLGIVLGARLEQTFIQSLMRADGVLDFFVRPVAGVLGVLTLLLWLSPLAGWFLRRRWPGVGQSPG